MGVCDQSHAPAALPPRKKAGNHCTGRWVSTMRKIFLPPEFDPRTVRPRNQSLYRLRYPGPQNTQYLQKSPNDQYCIKSPTHLGAQRTILKELYIQWNIHKTCTQIQSCGHSARCKDVNNQLFWPKLNISKT
jgi:hypothetical protein